MLALALSGVLALTALVCFALAVGLVRRHPPAGIAFAALIIVPLWEVPISRALMTVGETSITPSDIVTLILFVVGVLEFTQLRANLQGWLIPWLFLGVLIALSLLRGAGTLGLGTATNEARQVLWLYFAMTWALAIRPHRLKLHTVSLVLGWTLVIVALYHVARYGIGSPTGMSFRADGSYGPNRILVSGQAMALLLSAGTLFLGTTNSGKGRPRFVWSALVFLGVVLLSQTRSVWVGGLVGMTAVLIFAKEGHTRGSARSRAVALLVAGASLAFIASTFRNPVYDLINSATDSNTLEWRVTGWQILVSDAIARGPVTVATGEPFGVGFVRKIGLSTVGVQPHNWYVELFLRLGIIGLLVFAGMLMAAVLKSRARPELMFSLVAVGAYASFYEVNWYLAPWLAAAVVVSLKGSSVAGGALGSSRPRPPTQGGLVQAPAPGSTRP